LIRRKDSHCSLYKAYEGRNVVILGAAGFIGRWLARSLSKNGANVFLFVRDKSAAKRIFDQYDINGVVFDVDLINNKDSLSSIFQTISPDVIFNLAGYGVNPTQRDNDTAYKVNADLIKTVCNAMVVTKNNSWDGQDIVHVGSALEYGRDTSDLSETRRCFPTTLYGKSKLLGTQRLTKYCEQYGLKGVTVRLFSVYGPGEHSGRLLPSLINRRKGQVVQMTEGVQKRDFTYIDDVIEGMLRIGAMGKSKFFKNGGIINLASGQLNSVRSFVEIAASILKIDTKNLQFGKIPIRNEEMQHLPVSNHLLQQQTHWVPTVSIAEGVSRCATFLKSIE
jgi:UDP-glucose 4-epimerase